MQVKINNKDYEVPQLGFKDMSTMESVAGESIISVFQKQQMFVLAEAFVADIVGCSKDEASRLCEQHILGGGKLEDIYKAFTYAVNESDFFKKLLDTKKEKISRKEAELETE